MCLLLPLLLLLLICIMLVVPAFLLVDVDVLLARSLSSLFVMLFDALDVLMACLKFCWFTS